MVKEISKAEKLEQDAIDMLQLFEHFYNVAEHESQAPEGWRFDFIQNTAELIVTDHQGKRFVLTARVG